MVGLDAGAALDLWDRAQHLDPVWRAVELAAASEPAAPAAEVAALPLGSRDARLLRLRGPAASAALDATAVCRGCGELVEFACDVGELLAAEGDGAPPAPLEVAGLVVAWRPPASVDIDAAARAGDAGAARDVLLERCVLRAAGPDGAVLAAGELSGAARDAVEGAMAAADPLAEVLVDLTCPACGEAFVADVDIASFVWAELDARARGVLADVDALARAYGWTESDVLALGERRRATYLRLARADQA